MNYTKIVSTVAVHVQEKNFVFYKNQDYNIRLVGKNGDVIKVQTIDITTSEDRKEVVNYIF